MGQTPQGMERRMVMQMLAHWRKLRGDRMFPFFDDVDPLEIPEIWANVFVLELGVYPDDPLFRLAGEAFAAASSPLRNIRISEVPGNTLAEQSVSYYQEFIKNGIPISRDGEFTKSDGTTMLYRGVILPMNDDCATISGLLGTTNRRDPTVVA